MSTVGGPNIVEDGLVLALDAANVKSFRGEPTVNLGYDNGVINWQVFNLTVVTSLQTITPNLRFRIVTTDLIGSFTVGAFRMRFPLSVLSNGLTYNLSYKWRLISGGPIFEMNDWGDTSLFNRVDISYGDYNYSSASGTRATYDNTFRFMDFNMSPNSVVEIWDIQLEQRNYATPFVNGTRGTTVATGGGWADRSGNNNHGELVNGPTFNSDNLGSLVFDGVDDFILSEAPDINGYPFTLSCWCLPNTSNRQIAISLHSDATAYFGVGTNNDRWSIEARPPQNIFTSSTSVILERWANLACIFSSETERVLLLDGNVIGIDNRATTFNPFSEFFIGRQRFQTAGHGALFFNGNISQVQIYNRALTAEEILQNYRSTKGRYGL